jgi:hypothetical protein
MRTIYVTAQSAPTAGAAESSDSPYHKSVLIRHNWPNLTNIAFIYQMIAVNYI